MALMQHEALLLAQAFYKDGTASFEGVSRSMLGHPATAGRHALFSPAACAQHYRNLFAAERVDSSQLPADVKQPQSRTHLKLIRKYYFLREIEARERLCRQEEQMRVLSRELSELDQGLWDSRLTNSYILIEPSPDPALAKYAHINSAVAATFKSQVPPGYDTSTEQLAIHSASKQPGSEGGEEYVSAPKHARSTHEAAATVIAASTGPPPRIAPNMASGGHSGHTVGVDQLAYIPEAAEDEGPSGDTILPEKASHLTSTGKEAVRDPSSTAGRAERRSANRPSRITPSEPQGPTQASNVGAEHGILGAPEDDAVSPYPGLLDLEDGDEPRRSGKGRRRSSGPREANKRRRTGTPQARGPSPALSDVSRTKRIKTEEMESSVSTPVADYERTPFSGSDAGSSRRFRNTAPHLISQLQGSVYSTYFKDPVKEGEAVNYFEIIKRPMDLKTLLQHVKAGRVTSTLEFTRDIYLIFANAIMYNGADNYVGQDATALFKEAQGLLQVLEQAESRLL